MTSEDKHINDEEQDIYSNYTSNWILLMNAIEHFERTTNYSFHISKSGCWIDNIDGMEIFHSSVNSYQKSNDKTKLETVKDCVNWLYKFKND